MNLQHLQSLNVSKRNRNGTGQTIVVQSTAHITKTRHVLKDMVTKKLSFKSNPQKNEES
jgi:hypothetical protein